MKKYICVLLSAALMMLMLTGCSCDHSWKKADCENPRTCSKCGETSGEAKGHDWEGATCTDPKTCITCGQAKGSPKGHKAESTQRIDVIECCLHTATYCSVCSQPLESESTSITTFSVDNRFLFSAEDFIKRMAYLAKDTHPNFSYRFAAGQVDELQILVDIDGNNSDEFFITFFSDTNVPVFESEASVPGIWCVSLCQVGTPDQLGTLIDKNILPLFCLTCDPLISEENDNLIAITKLASFANYLYYGEPFGYTEINGLLYEFVHMEVMDIASELVLIYADNWQKNG